MKIDPYKTKESYLKWKDGLEETIPNISESSSKLILRYLSDMEKGLNVANGSSKGSRSFIRLNQLRIRLPFLTKLFEKRFEGFDLAKAKEEEIFDIFNSMRNGTIKRADGKEYQAVADYVKCFKAFWHWYQKVSRKEGLDIQDITQDLDTSREKPRWVYLTEEQIKKLCEGAKYEYRVLMTFLFDTGVRSPTELVNLRVSDLYDDCKELMIRDEVSKTFGRRIKLMISSDIIKEYIKTKGLQNMDQLFNIKPTSVNKYLQRLAKRVLGDEEIPAGKKYSELTMYHFRHCSCCYWMPRYKSESALKYRFGWKKSDKIHYYSELLGMRDTISEEDMLLDVTKTEIEQRLSQSEKKNSILNEEMVALRSDMKKMLAKLSFLTDQADQKLIILNEAGR
jgi:integrase